jgi:uncharacterized protein (DUF1015 family)
MQIFPFRALYPNMDFLTDPASFFGTVKQDFRDYYESGFFLQSEEEAVYVYRLKGETRNYMGIVACTDIEDFLQGRIKKHELTLVPKVQKQIELILRRQAAVKPVMLAYPQQPEIAAWIQEQMDRRKPFFNLRIKEEDTRHTFWKVTEPEALQYIRRRFLQDVPKTYIADGHHRTEATAHMYRLSRRKKMDKPYHRLLAAFFQEDQLDIQDFNRLVVRPDGFSESYFMARIAQLTDIQILDRARKPDKKYEVLMGLNGEWYMLRWKSWVLEQHAGMPALLDSFLLNRYVLEDLLDIQDVQNDERVSYVEGPKGFEGLFNKVNKLDDPISFCLYPVYMEEMFSLARADKTLPPKSTWFEPRMKNGLMVYGF